MIFEKEGDTLHLVRLKTKPWFHMTVTSDPDSSMEIVNTNLRQGTFTDPHLQHQYDICKKEMGNDPDPQDIVFHQFMTSDRQNGYQAGHWFIRDHIAKGFSLKHISNIGDWWSTQAYFYGAEDTPDPDDAGKKYKVTDLGKYFFSSGLYELGKLPMYFLPGEDGGDTYDEIIETHRLEQPSFGYSRVAIKTGMSFYLLTYNNSKKVLSEEDNLKATSLPVKADGLLYSSVLELALAKNTPVWFLLEMLDAETDPNWRYV